MAYLSISEAIAKHGKSESTYRRLIRDVRRSGDVRKRRLIKPSEDEIKQFRDRAEQFAYTLAEELIEQELFGRKVEQGSEPSAPSSPHGGEQLQQLLDKIERRYEQEIERLERQLAEEKREKTALLEYAQKDKELFAQASQSLTQVLALPGIAEATKARSNRSIDGDAFDRVPDREQGSERSGEATSSSNKAKPPSRSFLKRLFRRN